MTAKPRKLFCHDCGIRIRVSLEGYTEHYEPTTDGFAEWFWHHDCRPPWQIQEPDD